MSRPTDDELVRRFQAGDDRDGAFMELFERYGPITLAFLRRRIGNVDLASEIHQDLFLGVLRSLDGFRGQSSFKTWLFRMAQNRIHNLRRRWRTHLDELPSGTPEALADDVVPAAAEAPERGIARQRLDATLRRCLASLGEVQRAVVIGNYWAGTTLESLTRSLGLTNRSGARASLIAAQRKLRRCLESAGFDAADIEA